MEIHTSWDVPEWISVPVVEVSLEAIANVSVGLNIEKTKEFEFFGSTYIHIEGINYYNSVF